MFLSRRKIVNQNQKVFYFFGSAKISTLSIRETNINRKFINFIAKTIDFPRKNGYIIYVSVSTQTLQVLKFGKKRGKEYG